MPFVWLSVWLWAWWPLVGVVPAGYAAYRVTRPLAKRAPSSFKTAGGAALCLATKEFDPAIAARAEVTSCVRWIIAEELAMDVEDVTVDTKWADLV
jgi:hypothetical protein